ncbi:hypothetical protein [Zobellia sp. 1_MG-2023]|uniref:hypothetical protein n=1 Tax=Zobellia sp. 1_MG-2023 TaxID=3062626 RepID=UPI0026E49420|nr:hypothetical protein [Zobellia sp. 1_MG-2023]MDO6818897.1 hypothetical protein [Zobellia sp. 1_MG-2023]
MSEIIFKKLFEVQILHDYFLTTTDGTSFFERNKAEKEELLTKKLAHSIYDVREFVRITPIQDTMQAMNEYNILFTKTPLGFIVGIEVIAEDLAGATIYKPRLKVPASINLSFSMLPLISSFKTITNTGFRSPFPAIHYFTNKCRLELDELTIPIYKSLQLTNKFMPHQPGMDHEMGALIDFGGTLKEALQRTDGTDSSHWEDVEDRGIVSDSDRNLLPHNFNYSLKKEDAVTDINFVLEDATATVVKTITKSSAEALENVALNFTKIDETDTTSAAIPSGNYILKVTANAGPEIVFPIHLNDMLYDDGEFDIIDLRFDEPDSPYSLLDAGGFLKTRISAADVLIPHPIFELRFQNRRTYWRYNSESLFTAAEITDTSAHLVPETVANKKLVSIKPKALTEAFVPFINGTSQVLPHPKISSLRVEKEKIFSEIFINQSNRLLNS